jgi:hypothetical protein
MTHDLEEQIDKKRVHTNDGEKIPELAKTS